jgi:hypothetical protein
MYFQEVDVITIFNFVIKHAMFSEIDHNFLQELFQYIDPLSLPETPYVTGQSLISKNHLKTYFSIDSLHQLVGTLNRFGYFRHKEAPHLSMFSRAGK